MSGQPSLMRYADVTPEWLTGVLRRKWADAEVKAVQPGPVFGYKKNKFRVEVDYANPATAAARSFIVKGNFPGENDPQTGSAWAMANELRSLRDIVPLVAAPAQPESYYIGVTDEVSEIVMEDLTPKGATFFHAYHTLNLPQAMAFMDAMARMYASHWNSAAFLPGGVMGPETLAGENRRLVNDVYFPTFFTPENWQSYVELPRGRAMPAMFQDMDRAHKAWTTLWGLLDQTAMTVIHGDEHLGNLFVTAEGKPGLIDWVARPERWPIGIAYFMLCSLDVVDRRKWDRLLLSHFISRLHAHGAQDVPSLEDAWFFYRCATFYPVVTWLNNSGIWQPEAINTVNTVRAVAAALDHDAFGLMGV